jgi:hypothetical protein
MTRPCNQTYNLYPRLLGLILHPDLFKLRLDKFNVIINVINITLASDVAAKPKTLRNNFVKTPNIFRS